MEVELLPILEPGLELVFMVLGIILTALASWAIKKFADKLGVEETEKMYKYIVALIDQGLNLAKKKSIEELRDSNITIKIDNPKIAFVAEYVVKNAPKYLARLEIDEDKLVDLIESKL